MIIAPSLLAADFANLAAELARLEASAADWVHLDVMDGHFVPNLTFGPAVIAALRSHTRLPFDVHLMIESPERTVLEYLSAGADFVTIHGEASKHLHRAITAIRQAGAKAGIALNPATEPRVLEYLLPLLDLVLVMTVNPGFGGQEFIPQMLPKIHTIRQMIGARSIKLAVDGGIGLTNAEQVLTAGADVLVAGSAIFRAPDLGAAISGLRALAKPNN